MSRTFGPEAPLTAAAAIRFCRGKAGLSARALSLKAGLGEAYVCRVESGSLEPSLRAFARLAAVLGMSNAEMAVVLRHEATIPARNGKAAAG